MAAETGTLAGVRVSLRGGPVYSGGTGGIVKCSIQADVAGKPSGTALGTFASITPGNPGVWTTYPEFVLSAPVIAGQPYHAVFEDIDANQTANYCSINELYTYSTQTPRQPRYTDAEYGILEWSGSSWSVRPKDSPVMDIRYTSGTHQGMGYVGMIGIQGMAVYAASVTGNAKVRSTFTLTAARTITGFGVRLRRDHGTDPLFFTVRQGTNTLTEGQIPSTQVAQSSAGGDNGGQVWVTGLLLSATLPPGTYEVRLSCASASQYTAAAIREGTDVGFAPVVSFPDGGMQTSTDGGSTWADIYSSPLDLQFYLQ